MRGRGLLCRSIMKSQMASPSFTNIYAALVAVMNTKFPEIGELLLTRVVLQFRRAYKRNDKPICIAASKFLAHLVNQQARARMCSMGIRPGVKGTVSLIKAGPSHSVLSQLT